MTNNNICRSYNLRITSLCLMRIYSSTGIGAIVNVRFPLSFSAVLWDPPATAGVLSGLSYIVIVMNNNTGQVIISATTNNTIYPLPGAPTPCQYYTANVTAFSSEYYSESVVIGQRTTGGKYYEFRFPSQYQRCLASCS